MASLPFAVMPAAASVRRVGNAQSGILELPVRGGLTVQEDHVISELQDGGTDVFTRAAQIADLIAKAEGISLMEAYELIQSSLRGTELEPQAKEIQLRQAEHISTVAKLQAEAGRQNMIATVTALVRCRLNLPEWSTADTEGMPRVLLLGVWALAQDEIAAEAQPAAEVTEELLGKPLPVAIEPSQPTGEPSSGSCAMPSPASSKGRRSGKS